MAICPAAASPMIATKASFKPVRSVTSSWASTSGSASINSASNLILPARAQSPSWRRGRDRVPSPAGLRDLGRSHPFLFYRKLGYVVTGVMPDANGRGRPDIYMSKALEEA